MREETLQLDVCVYCKELITQEQHPYYTLENRKRAHLTCFLDHQDDEERDLGR